ncbi:MAG: glycosyltransferase [Balneolaceae bacterium]|nr:glycosyltransferase [Balneolaceae bacterium]
MFTVDLVSHIYPTKHDVSSGIFIQKEARLLAMQHKVNVWLPAVYALPWQQQAKRSFNPVDEEFLVNRIKYLSVPRRKLPAFTIANLSRALNRILSSSKSDIIHVHWLFPAGLCIPDIKQRLKKPIVLTLHGGDWYTNLNSGIDRMIADALHQTDVVICVGNQLKKDVLVKFPSLSEKIVHIPHGIDCSVFQPVAEEAKMSLRKTLSWDLESEHILCVANFYQEKGIELLVEAFSNISSKDQFHLHLVAPRRDRSIENKIQTILTENGLNQRASIYPSMSESELVKRYQAADFLVSPSRKEGFGLAIAEAIACGLPVLATKSGGPEEIVTEDSGILVEANNIKALENGLKSMMNEYNEYSSSILHQSISNRFSLTSKLDALTSIYRRLA